MVKNKDKDIGKKLSKPDWIKLWQVLRSKYFREYGGLNVSYDSFKVWVDQKCPVFQCKYFQKDIKKAMRDKIRDRKKSAKMEQEKIEQENHSFGDYLNLNDYKNNNINRIQELEKQVEELKDQLGEKNKCFLEVKHKYDTLQSNWKAIKAIVDDHDQDQDLNIPKSLERWEKLLKGTQISDSSVSRNLNYIKAYTKWLQNNMSDTQLSPVISTATLNAYLASDTFKDRINTEQTNREQAMRAGTEVSRFALNVLDKKVTFLRSMKLKGPRDFLTMSEDHVNKLQNILASNDINAIKSSSSNDYKVLLKFIVETGCRPNEALKTLEKSYWTFNKNDSTFLIPGTDSYGNKITKTGFDHRWILKSDYQKTIASDIRQLSNSELNYDGLRCYFERVCKLAKIRPEDNDRDYSLKHLRKAKAEKHFLKNHNVVLESSGSILHHRSKSAIHSYIRPSVQKSLPIDLL